MPSYDDDVPTQEEEILLKQLIETDNEQQRIRAIIQVQKYSAKISVFSLHKNYPRTIDFKKTDPYLLTETQTIKDCFQKSSFVKFFRLLVFNILLFPRTCVYLDYFFRLKIW